MAYKRIRPSAKLVTLPAKYTANLFGWDLDWRSPVGMKLAAEVLLLAQDLGGWDSLSRQKQILVEKAAYLRLKTAEYETADLQKQPVPFDAGTYSNKVNVLHGHLRTLGLERQARPVRTLAQVMRGDAAGPTPLSSASARFAEGSPRPLSPASCASLATSSSARMRTSP